MRILLAISIQRITNPIWIILMVVLFCNIDLNAQAKKSNKKTRTPYYYWIWSKKTIISGS